MIMINNDFAFNALLTLYQGCQIHNTHKLTKTGLPGYHPKIRSSQLNIHVIVYVYNSSRPLRGLRARRRFATLRAILLASLVRPYPILLASLRGWDTHTDKHCFLYKRYFLVVILPK